MSRWLIMRKPELAVQDNRHLLTGIEEIWQGCDVVMVPHLTLRAEIQLKLQSGQPS
jgi:hypothetical protein